MTTVTAILPLLLLQLPPATSQPPAELTPICRVVNGRSYVVGGTFIAEGKNHAIVLTCAHGFFHDPGTFRRRHISPSAYVNYGGKNYRVIHTYFARPDQAGTRPDLAAVVINKPPALRIAHVKPNAQLTTFYGFAGKQVGESPEFKSGPRAHIILKGTTRSGDSGSALFDQHGHVIGVLTGGIFGRPNNHTHVLAESGQALDNFIRGLAKSTKPPLRDSLLKEMSDDSSPNPPTSSLQPAAPTGSVDVVDDSPGPATTVPAAPEAPD